MKPKIIFSDFDGTLTNDQGYIDKTFLEILFVLQKRDIPFVPVSGRSVSWGHFLMTHFPIDFAIMEGGGVVLTKDEKGLIVEECLVSDEHIIELNELIFKLAKTKYRDYLSADSYGRKTDQAIEIYALSDGDQRELQDTLKSEGANFSKSSVHLNFWYGDVSKAKGVEYFLKFYTEGVQPEECLFFGDAANDESLFRYIPYTVGVSNIGPYLEMMSVHPRILLEGEENSFSSGVLNFLQNNL